MISQAHDAKTGKSYPEGTILDLGEERNTNAVNNGLAIWVDSSEFTEVKKEAEKEKKEGTPKKTTSSARGKKIETK